MRNLVMLCAAAIAAMGAYASPEAVEFGTPHCRVEYYDDFEHEYCTDIDPAEPGKDYALVWADGEDSAAIPVFGALTADEVVVNGGQATAFLQPVVIETDADFKGSSCSVNCDCGCDSIDDNRKWIVIKIKKSASCRNPVSFTVGLDGYSVVRKFWVVPESWELEEAIDYIETPIYKVSFDANGGELIELSRDVRKGAALGTPPTPVRSKYKFLGWYTEREGGTKVTATTKVTGDVTYYAQWVYDGSATVSANVFDDCKDMGKVTGGKMAKAGTKVTLKATANKGYVFAGWFEYNEEIGDHVPCDSSETDYRNPSYAYTVGEDDKTFYAMFKPAEYDDVLMLLVNDGMEDSWINPDEEELETFTVEDEQHLKLTVLSASLPKVSVKGLPAGMKFTDKPVYKKGSKTEIEYPANTIYGAPTKPGVYKVSVSLTNTSIKKAIVCEFEIFVPNFVSEVFPGLSPDPDEYCFEAGTGIGPWSIDCAASSDDWKVTVSGLPAGLKWDAKEQGLVGVPTKPGVYTVTFTAKRGKETEVATITMNIEALPAAAYGSFNGFVTRGDGLFNKVGSFQMTVSDVGKISVKVVTAAGSYSYSATGWTVGGWTPYRVEMVSKKGDWVDLYLQTDVEWNGDQITGSFFDADGNEYNISAQKTVFGEPWYFKAKSNDGNWDLVRTWDKKAADITVTVKDGTTKLAGKIDGMSVNSSGFVDMSDFANGCMKASFTPVVTVNKVKKVLVVDAKLWFDANVSDCGMAGFNE